MSGDKAIIIGRYNPPEGDALIQAQKLKQDEGRLTIHEAMVELEEKTGEFFNLSNAVKAGEILTYAPGSHKALKGNVDNRSNNEEAYPADLNAWLDANEQRVVWRFPATATKPKQSKPKKKDERNQEWQAELESMAAALIEQNKKSLAIKGSLARKLALKTGDDAATIERNTRKTW